MTSASEFDLFGPLPTGTTVLEASAGTGKTYTIAALATRYLAEGVISIDQMMLVTFGRVATAELQSRVYERLLACRDDLADFVALQQPPVDDLGQWLCRADTGEVHRRLARIEDAISNFDQAVIATTHEFCSRMLHELGVLVDYDDSEHFVEDERALLDQVGADCYLRQALVDPEQPGANQLESSQPGSNQSGLTGLGPGQSAFSAPGVSQPALTLKTAQAIAGAVHDWPLARLLPDTDPPTPAVQFARRVREELSRRKRRNRSYSFEDMVLRLQAALDDPMSGQRARELLASRFPLVMIDEFQDTDPVQWQIVLRAFHQRSTVVLIGDPKQAIYFFRGADVHSYLVARRHADHSLGLGTNYRGDVAIVSGVQALFGRTGMGGPHGEISLTPVSASHSESRLRGVSSPAIQIRVLDSAGKLSPDEAVTAVGADLATQVNELLRTGQLRTPTGERRLRASDIAVLVRVNANGEAIAAQLRAAGIPCVCTGSTEVFETQAAEDWQRLLTALVDPNVATIARAAITSLIGWDIYRFINATDTDRDHLGVVLRQAGELLDGAGVAAVFELLSGTQQLYPRLLVSPGGDRLLTDLRQVAQELHRTQRRDRLSGAALLHWLDQQRSVASGTQERTRRLETDEPAVQILTVHRAKGLQYPVVLLPDFAEDRGGNLSRQAALLYHGEDAMAMDLAPNPATAKHLRLALNERRAEDLRALYVAATRASSRLVMWWAHTYRTYSSPLHRLVCNDEPAGAQPLPEYRTRNFPAHLNLPPDLISVVSFTPHEPPVSEPRIEQHPTIELRHFSANIDRDWARTSYSGLTREIHGLPLAANPGAIESDEPALDQAPPDETEPDPASLRHDAMHRRDDLNGLDYLNGQPESSASAETPAPAEAAISPMAHLPGGTQFGSVVHAVLEHLDTSAPDLDAEVQAHTAALIEQSPIAGVDAGSLATALRTVLDTPLGGLANDRRLRDFTPNDRLAELGFELPLGPVAGGHRSTVRELAELWSDPVLVPPDDPLVGYGEHLASTPAAGTVLAGFLTGSIDAVLRMRPNVTPRGGVIGTVPASPTRYVVIDYKTNRMPTALGEMLSVHHYHPDAMARAMIEAHYPLQALLYCVALHRYLTWRLPGYQPETHLGPVGYLFVRGMAGSSTPVVAGTPCGVFTWYPSAALVRAASTVLAGGDHEH